MTETYTEKRIDMEELYTSVFVIQYTPDGGADEVKFYDRPQLGVYVDYLLVVAACDYFNILNRKLYPESNASYHPHELNLQEFRKEVEGNE